MRKPILVLAFLILVSCAWSQTSFTSYYTTFTGTENPLQESVSGVPKWTNGTAAGLNLWGAVRKSGGRAYGVSMPSTYGDPTAIVSGSYSSQQAAIAIVSGSTTGVSAEVEVRLRSTISTNSNSGYELLCSVNTSDPYMQLVKWLGPNGAEHTGFEYIADYLARNQAASGNVPILCSPGDWFGMEVTGGTTTTTFKIYKNGQQLQMNMRSNGADVTTVPDNVGGNALTGGTPGVGFYTGTGSFSGTWGLSYFASGQRIAKTCNSADLTAAQTAASNFETILVPPGTCSLGGVTFSKPVKWLGSTGTNITLSNTSYNTVTKSSAGVIWFENLNFSISKSPADNAVKGFKVGPSTSAGWGYYPTVWYKNTFTVSGTGLFELGVNGHVLSTNTFTGGWDDSFIQIKDPADTEGSWSTVDSMGTNDATGYKNIYIENNTFTGGTNQGIDCDDSCRMVFRYNTTTNFDLNSHGLGSSAVGTRHWEAYSNVMKNSCTRGQGCGDETNQNHHIWIRGGTGVIYDNTIDSLDGFWGTKPEIYLSQDTNHEGGCPASGASYPLSHQIGWGYNGASQMVDAAYLWHNTLGSGSSFNLQIAWMYGCATPISGYIQSGREYIDNGATTSAKPGYTAYTYPHPLISGSTPAPPTYLRQIGAGRTLGAGHTTN